MCRGFCDAGLERARRERQCGLGGRSRGPQREGRVGGRIRGPGQHHFTVLLDQAVRQRARVFCGQRGWCYR